MRAHAGALVHAMEGTPLSFGGLAVSRGGGGCLASIVQCKSVILLKQRFLLGIIACF